SVEYHEPLIFWLRFSCTRPTRHPRRPGDFADVSMLPSKRVSNISGKTLPIRPRPRFGGPSGQAVGCPWMSFEFGFRWNCCKSQNRIQHESPSCAGPKKFMDVKHSSLGFRVIQYEIINLQPSRCPLQPL